MFNKTKHKGKKYFCKSCLQCFSGENVLNEHKKYCLLINKGQNVKLAKGFIEFKNFNRQIPVPFKIYADFERLLKGVDCGIGNACFSYEGISFKKNIKTIFHVVLLIKWCVLIINIFKKFVCIDKKIQFLNSLSVFLKNMVIVDL